MTEHRNQQWRDHVSNLIDQFIAAVKMRAEQLPTGSEDRDVRLQIVNRIVLGAHRLRFAAFDPMLFEEGKYYPSEIMGPQLSEVEKDLLK